MNIRHLLGKDVIIIHKTYSGVQTIFTGKLEYDPEKSLFVVWGKGILHSIIYRFFTRKMISNICFPWNSVIDIHENVILIVDEKD